MAAPHTATSTRAGASDKTACLSVTHIAAFVGLRQCGRYLRLSLSALHEAHSVSAGNAQSALGMPSCAIDRALADAGHQLEEDVAAELHRRNPDARHLPDKLPTPAATTKATAWEDFLKLLSTSPIAASGVSCWAAEVMLQGRPSPDSVVALSGRADFILLLWRGGKPVLRIVECKASAEPQTKFVVQLVLYRMLLLQRLSEAAAANGGRVRIGGREWPLTSGGGTDAAGGAAATEVPLQVECLLRIRGSGASAHVADNEAMSREEVESMTRQLVEKLMPGGRIARALDIRTPLQLVPYELDVHCTACSRAAECWVDSAVHGAVQLSGCGASEAQRLAGTAHVNDIEELAALLPSSAGGFFNGAVTAAVAPSVAGSPAMRQPESSESRRLAQVAADTGMTPLELQKLALAASVRSSRRLGPRPQVQQGQGAALATRPRPDFQLLPGAPPSCLPALAVRGALVRVYLSVAVDPVLRRIVGLAAHVAAPAHGGGGGGSRRAACSAAPPQAGQAGRNVGLLLEGVELDSNGAVSSPVPNLDRLEAGMLLDFSDQLCGAIQECIEQQQPQQQQEPQQQQQPDGIMLHFYVHSHHELRELIRRCSALADLPIQDQAGDHRPETTTSTARSLHWLPHLLGLRAGIPTPLEQCMVSLLEDEVRRYVTAWQGAGRRVATAVPWGGDGTTVYDWRVPARPAAPTTRPSGGAEGSDGGCDLLELFSAGSYLGCLRRSERQLVRQAEVLVRQDEHWRRQEEILRGRKAPFEGPPDAPSPQTRLDDPSRIAAYDKLTAEGFPYSGDGDVQLVQVRYDSPGEPIPPSFFRAFWAASQSRNEQPDHHHHQQYQKQQQQQQQQQHGLGSIYQRGAARLRELLLAQAHAVRWLEERLVRLPAGGDPRLRKEPLLALPPPLGPRLRAFRLDDRSLPGGPRHPREGLQAARATALARAALDAVWLNRSCELRQFWVGLGAQAPAVRAGADRGGAVVLDRLQRMNEGKEYWLRGRVVQPEGCRDAAALAEATGLEERSSVVVTVVGDPWVCQDTEQAMSRRACGVIRQIIGAGRSAATETDNGHVGTSDGAPACAPPGRDSDPSPHATAGGELWVECSRDFLRYPDNGLFLLGTERVWPWTFAGDGAAAAAGGRAAGGGATAGAKVVLDEAPNVGGWMATSVVECLQQYGGSSAYLAERLWLELPFVPDAPGVLAGAAAPLVEPRTPVSKIRAGGDDRDVHDAGGAGPPTTPASLIRGQQELLSPASTSASSPPRTLDRLTPPGTHPYRHSPPPASAVAAAASGPAASSTGAGGLAAFGGYGSRTSAGGDTLARWAAGLDHEQVACVRAFLEHPDSGARVLLQGPPGTGKTETMAAAVLAWLAERMRSGGPMGPKEQGGVVLLCGPTHAAIDNLLERIAARLADGGGGGGGGGVGPRGGAGERSRIELVRLSGRTKPLDPALAARGVRSALPTERAWRTEKWYVVGGTIRHLERAAGDLRVRAALHASPGGAELMELSGRGAFAAALVLDEASMLFAPQLLALSCLLVARGSLLVGGDHQQLSTIVQYDFEGELRPNLVRHRSYVSAYEYMRQLADWEAAGRRSDPRRCIAAEWIGGPPPPISVCALSYTHRLPPAVITLIQPLYLRDGITLVARPHSPPPPSTPPVTRAVVRAAAPLAAVAFQLHLQPSRPGPGPRSPPRPPPR